MTRLRSAAGPLFVGSDLYRRPAYGANHPLAIPRVATVMDLCWALGWLDERSYVESPRASAAELVRFHDPAYVRAVERVDRVGRADARTRARHGLGTAENPVFHGLFARAATCCGGSLLAARLVAEGGVAYNPAGGTHHGRPDRASGFCYFNDPVLAILALLDRGLSRVLYVDLDAHHGDGVEDAFAGDARVLAVSVHEAGRWPHTGGVGDGGPEALNYPVPRGFNDSELAYLMEWAVLPAARAFAPEAVVITCGADGLAGDPLSGLALTNGALWRAVEALVRLSPRTVVLGGGGYNPWTLARCWAGLWGVLAGYPIPSVLPPEARAVLERLSSDLVEEDEVDEVWLSTLADPPKNGPVREEVRALVRDDAA